jgi:hypothetical protein
MNEVAVQGQNAHDPDLGPHLLVAKLDGLKRIVVEQEGCA